MHPAVSRRRGAALVEFALVGPIFITIMVGLLQICFWLWNQETLSIAARTAARGAVIGVTAGEPRSAGAADLSRLLAGKVAVVTPAYPVAVEVGVFASANGGDCLARRNAVNPANRSDTVYARLGWDWVCTDFTRDPVLAATFPGADTARDAAHDALVAGMAAAVRQLYGSDRGGNIWLGPHGETTLTACYVAVSTVDNSERCLYELSATIGEGGDFEPGAVRTSSDTIGEATDAPVLVRVRIASTAPTLIGINLFGPLGVALEGSGAYWIDRYRPTCPAPRSADEYKTGTCGGVH